MLEELCHGDLWSICCSFIEMVPNVKLKEKYRSPSYYTKLNLYYTANDFMDGADRVMRFNLLPKLTGRAGAMNWTKRNVNREAWEYFTDNGRDIITGFIRDEYGGYWRQAMRETQHFEAMHDAYLEYFKKRRERFLENEKQLVAVSVEKLTRQGRKPASHGGVASLLTVLTRTMQDQGSSILTIAKVQYAVCVQAGIMLPNEFLTDVLVADQIIHGE